MDDSIPESSMGAHANLYLLPDSGSLHRASKQKFSAKIVIIFISLNIRFGCSKEPSQSVLLIPTTYVLVKN